MIWNVLISFLLLLQVSGGDTLSGAFSRTGSRSDAEERVSPPEQVSESEGSVDVAEIIFEHIGDAYEWHIFSWGDRHVKLHLPVIVHSSTGWHIFSSKKLEHGESYEGLKIDPEKGKIVEVDSGKRPFDISITKNVLALMMSSLLLLVVILCTARWYKKHDVLNEAPTGIAALMEPLVMMVHDMARENIGEEDYRKYSPYLCMAFLFILLNNFLGIMPFFPGGANLTGNIAITLVLALFTFFTVNLTGSKHYYKEIFNPDVPVFLKPVMPVIEVFSAFMKPVSLTIRLFANMLAGHIMILCMVCIIFIMAKYGPVLTGSMTVVSVIFGVFLDALECLVAFIQAYVFTMLSSIYIGLARAHEE
jgi:F-type H+-transporting ATPase subunit a